MGLGDLIKSTVDKVIETGEDLISRPEKNPDGSKGQAPPGALTKNVQGKNGMEKFTPLLGLKQTDPGKLTNNIGGDLGIINSGNESNPQSFYKNHADDININGSSVDGITPDELTNNIGNNDIESYSISQSQPGILTPNVNGITSGRIIEGYENTADDIVNLGTEAVGNPVVDPITEDELTPNIGTYLGLNHTQLLPGELTDNVDNFTIDDYAVEQDPAGELTNNIGNPLIQEQNITQSNPGELTPNIGNNDITDGNFVQDNPGFLTTNIGNDLLADSKRFNQKDPGEITENIAGLNEFSPANAFMSVPRFTQDEPGEVTSNIGNDVMDDTLWDQGTPDITTNIGNTEMNDLLWEQDEPGILTPNIANDLEPVFEQSVPGKITDNVGNDLGETYEQLDSGKLTKNIGTDLGNSHEQIIAGELTNNIGANDIDEHKIEQSEPGKLTTNIGNKVIQDGTRIEQNKAGILTPNIANKNIKEQSIEQVPAGELTNNVGNNDLEDELFNNEPKNNNIGNDLDPTYVNPEIKERNNDLGVNHEQLKAGELTDNVAPENQNIGNDLREQYENPTKVQKQPTIDQLFENPEVRRQVELDTIQNQMRNRANIGTDLGKLF